MYFANLKSGIGSCIAPKAGLARHPAKGMYRAGMFLTFRLVIAPYQGVVGATPLPNFCYDANLQIQGAPE